MHRMLKAAAGKPENTGAHARVICVADAVSLTITAYNASKRA